MHRRAARWLGRIVLVAAASLATLLAMRAWEASRAPPLLPWHVEVPRELDATAIDRIDWAGWITHEAALLDQVDAALGADLPATHAVASNRYWPGSPMHRSRRDEDWNRSYALEPDGPPRGVAVLLHGLTDSPYSLRHVAQHYRARGFVTVGARLPGHGTVPAGLTATGRADWHAATRLAVREARRRVPEGPLHVVGYSTGAALALAHALDVLDGAEAPRADRIVMLSPMIGVSALARFAGVLGWPAVFPAFARAAWIDVAPEYNPYKYNSFPVRAARESSLLARDVQARLARRAADGALADLPPILAFQSTVDATVSTPAVVAALFARLPANGSELVLFDLDRRADLGPLTHRRNPSADDLLPPSPRPWTACDYSNAGRSDAVLVERCTPAGESVARLRETGLRFPDGVYSLSHVALPFPVRDGLYGLAPDPGDIPGVHLGSLPARGERGVLVVAAADLARITSNPFFDEIVARIDRAIDADVAPAPLNAPAPAAPAP
jgi:alpha-beta hydrolase superfamily lysophospholipase